MNIAVLEGLTEVKAQLNESICKSIVEASVIFVKCNEGVEVDFTKYKEEADKRRGLIQKALDIFKRGINKILDAFKSHQALFDKYSNKIGYLLKNGDLSKLKPFDEIISKKIEFPRMENVLKSIVGRDSNAIIKELDKCKTFDDFRIKAYSIFQNVPKRYSDVYNKVRFEFYGDNKTPIQDILQRDTFKTETVSLEDYVKRTGDVVGNFLKFDIENLVSNISDYDYINNTYNDMDEVHEKLYNYFVEMYHRFKSTNHPDYVYTSIIEFLNIINMIMGAYKEIIILNYNCIAYIADERYKYINKYLKYIIDEANKAYVNATNS